MSEEKFIKALARRTHLKLKALGEEWGATFIERERLARAGDATIEALKEMMVGEPRKGTLRHRPWYQNTGLSTDIDTGGEILCWDIQKRGIDGEKVVVLVVCLQ